MNSLNRYDSIIEKLKNNIDNAVEIYDNYIQFKKISKKIWQIK